MYFISLPDYSFITIYMITINITYFISHRQLQNQSLTVVIKSNRLKLVYTQWIFNKKLMKLLDTVHIHFLHQFFTYTVANRQVN